MNGFTPLTAGRRWLKKFGFALWAGALVGGVFGALAFFRTERLHEDDDTSALSLHWLRDHFESLELATYDWRARALGEMGAPAEDVVVVAIDDATLASARQNPHPGIALQPWPREFVGVLTRELVQEGARGVLLDSPYPDLSPRACPGLLPGSPAGPEDEVMELGDDWRFRAHLDELPDKSVLAFTWSEGRGARAESRLTPFGLHLGSPASVDEALPLVRRVLSDRQKLFVVPEGQHVELWAGADSVAECQELARAWGLPGTPEIRGLTPAELDRPFTAQDLLVQVAEVAVDGLDADQLPRVSDVQAPVPALLSKESRYGGLDTPPGVDGVVRSFQHLVGYRAKREGRIHVLPSAPLAAAMQWAGVRSLRYRAGRLEIGDTLSVPMEPDGTSLMRWEAGALHGGAGTPKRAVPAWNVVKNVLDEVNGQPHQFDNALSKRFAVLANTATGSPDVVHTPVGRRTPSGVLLAQALSNLLHSEGLVRAPPSLDFVLAFGMAFLGALLALAFSRSLSGSGGVALHLFSVVMAAAVYLFAARQMFINHHLWIAVAAPVSSLALAFALSTAHAVRTERDVREYVRAALGRPVTPELVRRVSRDVAHLRPGRRPATVLVAQIEGLGTWAESQAADRIVELAREVFGEVAASIQRNEGHVDAHAAEGLVAVWGAPIPTDWHAQLACEVALELRATLAERSEAWERRFGHVPRCRIGVDTGEVVVGDMGSLETPSYGTIGRPVGLALRLAQANELLGTSVLVGQQTAVSAAPDFAFREVDQLHVEGHAVPVRIFELMGRPDALGPGRLQQLDPFARALEAYRHQRFLEALELFEQCRELADPAAAVYVERCRVYFSTPPPQDWDGVFAVDALPAVRAVPRAPYSGPRRAR